VGTEDLTSFLESEGAEYELLPHARTDSALAEAEALGLDPADVAKTLVLATPSGHLRVVVPASERLDLRKVGELIGAGKKKVHLASEEALARDYPEFDLGAVPPVGGGSRDPVIVDRRVAGREAVVVEAGSHEQSVRLKTADLIRLASAETADVCQDAEPTPGESAHPAS
jgi:Ala-tRNA(Pro) deacylase